MRPNPEISVVIPAFNEQKNLEKLLPELQKVLSSFSFEVIVVNDCSTDDTEAFVKSQNNGNPAIQLISFSRNFGHQAALKAGIDYASGNCVIMMDADMQHPPSLLPEMIARWKEGYEVVFTRRMNEKDISVSKKITSKYFYKLFRKLSGINMEEGTADFRLIDARVADVIRKSNDNFLFIRGLIPWVGFRQFKLSYKAEPRFSGSTKYSFRKMITFGINGITGFSVKPLRFATILGLLMSMLSFSYGIYAIAVYLFNDRVISGWASMLISVLFIGGIQLIILGIMGEYIGKIYLQLKNRPFYIVREKWLNNR